MSGYNGRHGPNVSHYVANLNKINPSPQEVPADLVTPVSSDEFSLFTNSEFFETDTGSAFDFDNSLDLTLAADKPRASVDTNPGNPLRASNPNGAQPNMDFDFAGDFQFSEFPSFSGLDHSIQGLPHAQSNNFGVPPTYTSPPSASLSPITPGFDHAAAKKRKLDSSTSQQSIDEAARQAAEEDKRRRNTAASARFRVKKKQREQALEKTAKEMSDRVSVLETRIQQLETENTWLKSLITEKNGGKSSSSDIKAILTKHEESNGERSTSSRDDGVGTQAEDTKA
ncbi:hypothetical protein BS50DRAFT_647646 [Corynespora cassiicola Philippines]|uniref:BZIP domain-containing protein n=1 Tax=Corynespora cassiicola Philippines TaxID=1448308 RepID=A0A2T2NEH7_CORCC|nr:hypothetical protein BS50DRAFT_647646 [Corynespora cassiicola Philippines]